MAGTPWRRKAGASGSAPVSGQQQRQREKETESGRGRAGQLLPPPVQRPAWTHKTSTFRQVGEQSDDRRIYMREKTGQQTCDKWMPAKGE